MDKLQAYNKFWNSFGLPAYDQYTVPSNAALPYITYESASDDFDHPVTLSASIWYRDASWAAITAKEKEISEVIGRGGVSVPYDDGGFWLVKGMPWAQRMNDPDDDTVRRIVLTFSIEFID
ncbi:MAG: hypothetical protein K6F28_09960 [Lachnospiraceae bacterium]|nr:hypothetical protein [Lachnospiraceae bacterium]